MTGTLTDAQLLRAAAEKLRQLAKQATPGPWEIEWSYGGDTPQVIFRMDPDHPDDPDLSMSVGVMDEPGDNAWVATLHPGLAGPLAAWLEHAQALHCDWCGSTEWTCAGYAHSQMKCCPDCAHGRRALAVARVIVGVQSDG